MSKKLQLGTGQKKDALLILGCFKGAMALLQPYWNKWIVSDVWVDIINSLYDIPDDLQFTSKELIVAVSRNKVYKSNNIETTAMANPMGLYKAWFKSGRAQRRGKICTPQNAPNRYRPRLYFSESTIIRKDKSPALVFSQYYTFLFF